MKGRVQKYRDGNWRVYFKGQYYYVDRYGTPFKAEFYAYKALAEMNEMLAGGRFKPEEWRKSNEYKFENLIETYLKVKRSDSDWPVARERIARRHLIPFFQGEILREMNGTKIDKFKSYLEEKKLSPKTVQNILTVLKAFLNYCCGNDVILKVPKVPVVEVQEPEIRFLTEEEQDRVFRLIPSRHLPIFEFMRHTACRPNEAGGLLRSNIHTDEGFVVIATTLSKNGGRVRERTKNKQVRVLKIAPNIAECLRPREVTRFAFSHNGEPYSIDYLERIWNKANQLSGVKKINLYNGLKHSKGCQLISLGYHREEVAELMGHRNVRSTMRYTKYDTNRVGEMIEGKSKFGANLVQAKNDVPNLLKQ